MDRTIYNSFQTTSYSSGISKTDYSRVEQMEAYWSHKSAVVGSNPTSAINFLKLRTGSKDDRSMMFLTLVN